MRPHLNTLLFNNSKKRTLVAQPFVEAFVSHYEHATIKFFSKVSNVFFLASLFLVVIVTTKKLFSTSRES